MGEKVLDMTSGIIVALIGLAVVAVLVSQKAQTGGVIGALGTSLAGIISAATSPITGTGGVTLNGGRSGAGFGSGGGGFDPSSLMSGFGGGGGAFGPLTGILGGGGVPGNITSIMPM